ncbi:GL22978 [Drosophila persimilis]|uniref:GL22978 n=1 Tax=Drosophila persimilis TaxID=7234 RepID=B4H9T4_DROPE|nr:GL22978 [Drosophila persimilis]
MMFAIACFSLVLPALTLSQGYLKENFPRSQEIRKGTDIGQQDYETCGGGVCASNGYRFASFANICRLNDYNIRLVFAGHAASTTSATKDPSTTTTSKSSTTSTSNDQSATTITTTNNDNSTTTSTETSPTTTTNDLSTTITDFSTASITNDPITKTSTGVSTTSTTNDPSTTTTTEASTTSSSTESNSAVDRVTIQITGSNGRSLRFSLSDLASEGVTCNDVYTLEVTRGSTVLFQFAGCAGADSTFPTTVGSTILSDSNTNPKTKPPSYLFYHTSTSVIQTHNTR